jgi:hypothetical protein
MKKAIFKIVNVAICIISLSSCATLLGGQVSECQRTKPKKGQPARPIRAEALVADVLLFWPGALIDFATGAIYKPCETKTK